MAFDPQLRSLDEVDWDVLDALQSDGRLSMAALGRHVGLSAPAVAERVRKLEDRGIVTGYHAAVDRARAGRPLLAFVRVATSGGLADGVRAVAEASPAVVAVHRVTGDDCYVMEVAVRDVADLEGVVDAFVRFGRVTTSVVLSTVLERQALRRPTPPAGAA